MFGSTAWARISHDKRKYFQPQSVEFFFIGYPNESKGFKIIDIKTKQIIIEISVWFDEPLQEVELVKEKTVEIPSCSANHLDDEIGSDGSDFYDMIYDISQQQISGSKSDS